MESEYLNGNLKDIFEPMISALITAQPKDPIYFMLIWLKNLYSLDYVKTYKDKEELENLRLEKKYLLEAPKEKKSKENQNLIDESKEEKKVEDDEEEKDGGEEEEEEDEKKEEENDKKDETSFVKKQDLLRFSSEESEK